jgi:hypothetical protein
VKFTNRFGHDSVLYYTNELSRTAVSKRLTVCELVVSSTGLNERENEFMRETDFARHCNEFANNHS